MCVCHRIFEVCIYLFPENNLGMQNKDSTFCYVLLDVGGNTSSFLLLSSMWTCVWKSWRLRRLGFVATFSVGWWPRKVSSCTCINCVWWSGAVITWVGSRLLTLAKRKCWRNLGPDGTRPRELSQLKGLFQGQGCDLQSQKGQSMSWVQSISTFRMGLLPTGNRGNEVQPPGERQGQGCRKVLNSCSMGFDGSRQSSRRSSGLGY